MTKEEAFKLYLNKQSISMRELWDAACEWQRETDAQIADDNQFESWIGDFIRTQEIKE